jgi:AraC-like DNA-binding protein
MAASSSATNVTIWQAPEMKAEMLRGQFVNFSYDVHTHETACFALITAGQIRIRMRGTEFIANKGDLYAIDADQPHAGWAVDADGWKLRTLYVDTGYLRSLVQDGQNQPPGVTGPIIRNARLAHLLHSLHQGSEEQAPRLLRDQACIAFASELLHRHVRKPVATFVASQEPVAVRVAREMLDQHMGDQLSLQELGAAADVPPFVLLRAFERSTGMSPHAYQRQARIRLVMRLIRAGHSLSDASVMAGFSDQAHCTRWFRRFIGITPGQYQGSLSLNSGGRLR